MPPKNNSQTSIGKLAVPATLFISVIMSMGTTIFNLMEDNNKQTIDNIKEKVENVTEDVEKLKDKNMDAEFAIVNGKINTVDSRLGGIDEDINEIKGLITTINSNINSLSTGGLLSSNFSVDDLNNLETAAGTPPIVASAPPTESIDFAKLIREALAETFSPASLEIDEEVLPMALPPEVTGELSE